MIAAVLAYFEGRNSTPGNGGLNNENVHYFGNQQTNQIQYNTPPQTDQFDSKLIIIPVIVILAVIGVLLLSNMNISNDPVLNISNVNIESEGYSMYKVSCDLIPTKEFSYLGLVVIFYDSNGSEIGKSPLVWNINSPTKDQLIKVSGTALTNNQNYEPARAELLFFDTSFETDPSKAVYAVNVTINT